MYIIGYNIIIAMCFLTVLLISYRDLLLFSQNLKIHVLIQTNIYY